jgi:hypothetical protein
MIGRPAKILRLPVRTFVGTYSGGVHESSFSGTLLRIHGPLSLRTWDRIMALVAALLAWASLPLLAADRLLSAAVVLGGGVAVAIALSVDRRRAEALAWVHAAGSPDPVATLALLHYLRRIPFRDLVVISDWRTEREARGLPISDDPMAPPPVRTLFAELGPVNY